MRREYYINCRGIIFVEDSFPGAVECLVMNGSTYDCIIYDEDVIATLNGHGQVKGVDYG